MKKKEWALQVWLLLALLSCRVDEAEFALEEDKAEVGKREVRVAAWSKNPRSGVVLENFANTMMASGWTVKLIDPLEAHFYDATRYGGGDDELENGIDVGAVLLHMAHGSPEGWQVRPNNASVQEATASIAKIVVGEAISNHTTGGALRYYFQCSCKVLAHGPCRKNPAGSSSMARTPENCKAGSGLTYNEPSLFCETGCEEALSRDHPLERNVFERWTPALGRGLRLACAGSTAIRCKKENIARMFAAIEGGGQAIADSFLAGFGDPNAVPLCITQGGVNSGDTPLSDKKFTDQPNSFDRVALYAEYLELDRGERDDSCEIGAPSLPLYGTQGKKVPAVTRRAVIGDVGWGDGAIFDSAVERGVSLGSEGESGARRDADYRRDAASFIVENRWATAASLDAERCQVRRLAVQRIPVGPDVSKRDLSVGERGAAVICKESVKIDDCSIGVTNSEVIVVVRHDGKIAAGLNNRLAQRGEKRCFQRSVMDPEVACSIPDEWEEGFQFLGRELIYEVVQLDGVTVVAPFWQCTFERASGNREVPVLETRETRILAVDLEAPMPCLG